MASTDNLPIETGNYVDSEENVGNLVDILREGDQSSALFPDKHNILNTQPAKSGNMVGSDGNVYNIVDLIKNFSVSASNVETESGETVQEELNNSVKLEVEQGTVQSIGGTLEVATPDGSNPDAAVNVDYVDSVVGTIETALETV